MKHTQLNCGTVQWLHILMAHKLDVAGELIEMAVGSFTLNFTLPCVVGKMGEGGGEREEGRGERREGGGEREEEREDGMVSYTNFILRASLTFICPRPCAVVKSMVSMWAWGERGRREGSDFCPY